MTGWKIHHFGDGISELNIGIFQLVMLVFRAVTRGSFAGALLKIHLLDPDESMLGDILWKVWKVTPLSQKEHI